MTQDRQIALQPQRMPPRFVVWITAAVGVATLSGFWYDYLQERETRFAVIEGALADIRAHREADSEWKKRIVALELRERALTARSAERSTSFTEGQGEALERRIDGVERQCEELKYMRDRIDDLAEETRAAQLYYRRQIVPMLEQSNSLQQMRLQQQK